MNESEKYEFEELRGSESSEPSGVTTTTGVYKDLKSSNDTGRNQDATKERAERKQPVFLTFSNAPEDSSA